MSIETVLVVEGMSCANCVRHVDEALRRVEGVEAVEVHLAEGRAVVRHADGDLAPALVQAAEKAGYDARRA